MNKCYPTLLATMVWAALYSQQAHADLAAQCMLGVPVYDKPIITGDPNKIPINIKSDDTHGEYPNTVDFIGNVDIQQGNKTLTADKVRLKQTQDKEPVRTVTAIGNVRYDDPQIILKGPRAWANLNNKDTDVEQGNYQMVGRQGRGSADKMMLRDENRYTILNNGIFTSCLPGNDSWSVVGSEVILDREEQVAEIWNARFRVANVPVFYSPYLQLPIGDKRRSGFLIPNASFSNKDGFQFLLPYYWNIAPNYDATITPHLITMRGLKLDNEFRYLTEAGTGTVALDWIHNDRLYADDKKSDKNLAKRNSDSRWLFYWNHSGVMNQVWRFSADYTKVSDPNYFRDFSSQYGSSTDGYATQKFSVGYAQQNWNATLTTKQFQLFTIDDRRRAYRSEPQLDFNYYKNDLGPFDFHTYAQAAKFTSVGNQWPNATRLHLEPAINLPLSNGWASINNEFKLMATHYEQDISDSIKKNSQTATLEKSVNRVLPVFKSDAKMVFERAMYFNQDYTQTLEPRVQYLYVPYKNQNNINNFDSSLLQADYTGLFRDRFYSGLDRVSSANQFTTGMTTRVYDENLVERFSLSVGQIYYFERPRTEDTASISGGKDIIGNKKGTGATTWAGDAHWRINDSWGLKGGLQYDNRLGSLTMGNAVVEYHRDSDRMLQLNYRFVDRDYIQATLGNLPAYQQGISQVGMVASWPLSDRWAFVGAYYYDTKEKQPASQMVGLQYNTCCWAVNVGYERKIVNWRFGSSQYDNKWSFNVELRGLSNNHSLGSQKMLQQGILPYQRAF